MFRRNPNLEITTIISLGEGAGLVLSPEAIRFSNKFI